MSKNQSTIALLAVVLTLAAPCVTLAAGADAPGPSTPAGAPEPDLLQEVVVTGSRLPASFRAPTPVTTYSAEQLALVSPNDIATALAQTPALSDSILSSQAGSVSGAAGTNGQSLLNLRGLGVNRTLVLLNGQRLGTTNVQDSVDVNIIPQALLKRVDVVTGGASASYGSDAVAGVVNFVLDTNYQGFKADVSAGTTTYGDGTNGNITLAYGKAFGDDVRLIAGASFYKTGGIGLPPTGRNWNDNPDVGYPNPVAGTLPTLVIEPDGRSSDGTYGGLITGVKGCTTAACKALVNQQFGPGGTLEAFHQGANAGASYASGGDGATIPFGISPAMDRENAYLRTEWDVNSNLTLFVDGLFNRTYTSLDGQYAYQTGTVQFTIFPNNAYLPASVASVFAANPSLTSFTLGRFSHDLGDEIDDTLEEVGRVSFGAKGHINDRWSFDVSLAQQYTVNDLDVIEPINRNLYAAADAVVNPANGQIVCNSTLQGLDPGCVPVNLFGPGAVSAAARSYIEGVNRGDTIFGQTSFEANLRGDLGDHFTLGAGPISVATGIAYHHDNADRHVDALSSINTDCTGLRGCPATYQGRYGGYQFYNPSALHGSSSATEGYAEVGIPLLKGLPLIQSLNVDLAIRETDYSISGPQDSWKMGLQWSVNSSLMFRGTASQDVRAPDVLELFNSGSTKVSFDLFPYSSATTQSRISAVNATVGNPDLLPEISHTVTAGMVFTPSFLRGFQTSVDYYKIELDHAIESLISQGVVDGCALISKTYCSYITINQVPITNINQVTTATTGLVVTGPTQNVGVEGTSGVDLESAYTQPLGAGIITGRLIGNYLLSENLPTAITGCAQASLVGAIGGCLGQNGYPRWKANVSVHYDAPRFGVFLQERFIAGGKADPWDIQGVTITRNEVPTIAYTDLTLNYNVGSKSHGEVYLTVTNLFNRDPPTTITSAGAFDSITSYDVYDLLGRRFVLGFRLSL
jgi:outer membrane receptor protein involved in Fe transport